jgi:hypothetical protein
MAYTYLLDLYKLVDSKQAGAEKSMNESQVPAPYHQGRMDLLTEFQSFISEHLDDKLPKRIRKRLHSS